ncbi:M56 family metallopeptidase [Streptomyces sedi]|uniref:M56 family metallopeptidase n=2 Tax=Streptomyces sedi TaxID=555059 RepID=A0A5C4ULV1_9ACTN|nr:M56 family metallopeptidase [Streptomyces sedi]TNM24614.1 M56 family metallopeptidase [Streptomyces sedi]
MGWMVLLPLMAPLTALPLGRLAEQWSHPRVAARLLTGASAVLAACSTLSLVLLAVVGTAQLPGNPLPDSWSDPEVREAVPGPDALGVVALAVLGWTLLAVGGALVRRALVRVRLRRALAALPADADPALLPDERPYAYAVPGGLRRPGRIVVSTAMRAGLGADEYRALLAHERAHLAGRHHRYLLAGELAARAHPLLAPLRDAAAYAMERWADEDAARAVGDRGLTARAVGHAALVGHRPAPGLAGFAAGPVPRRVAALLRPLPPAGGWPPPTTRAGVAALVAAAGTTASALSALNAAVTLFLVLKAATQL